MNTRTIASVAPRFIAAVALGVAIVLGAGGCSMVSTQATTIPYSPADGINVSNDSGVLEIRNVLVVANDEGTEGNLVMAIVNDTDEAHTLNIEFGEGSDTGTATVRVPANEVLSLGAEGTDPLLLEGIDSKPGTNLPIFFQSGDGKGSLAMVPVLDGSLPYLADLVP